MTTMDQLPAGTSIWLTGTMAAIFTEEEGQLFKRWEKLGYSERVSIDLAHAHKDPSAEERAVATAKNPQKPCWMRHPQVTLGCPVIRYVEKCDYFGW